MVVVLMVIVMVVVSRLDGTNIIRRILITGNEIVSGGGESSPIQHSPGAFIFNVNIVLVAVISSRASSTQYVHPESCLITNSIRR